MIERQTFEIALREALNHFDDTEFLAASPLAAWLQVKGADFPASALRAELERAINVFRPARLALESGKCQRYHTLLHSRYVEGLTQQATANRLGITPRHLRREQIDAISALADYLDLVYELFGDQALFKQNLRELTTSSRPSVELNREMSWLAESYGQEVAEVEPVVCAVMELTRVLAREHDVTFSLSCGSCPPVAISRTVLKQIILNLITLAITQARRGSQVGIDVHMLRERLAVTFSMSADTLTEGQGPDALASVVDVSRQLTTVFGGQLTIVETDGILATRLELPTAEHRAVVLAIEDNLDTLALWQRFVQGTRFALTAEASPELAVERAASLQPELIILDVMLPGTDGWDILAQLRQHQETASIPVAVCTVLPQKELALSLGATDFIQKPITGREFRAVLERHIVAEAPR